MTAEDHPGDRFSGISALLHALRWRATAVSVRVKIMGIVLMLVFVPGIMVTVQVREAMTRVLREELQQESVSIARDVAARSTDLILINDLYGVADLLQKTRLNNPDVRYAFIVNPQGQVLAHTFGQGFPPALLQANTVGADRHHHTVMLQTDEGVVWDTAVPIFGGRAGYARVGVSETRMRAVLQKTTERLIFFTLVLALVGVLAATFLTWVLTRPLLDLTAVTEALRAGDFTQRVKPWADDEIGELAEAFNAMAEALSQAEEERQQREAMRTMYLQRIIEAQEAERRRIARELHDETGQALASLAVGLRNIEAAASRDEMLVRIAEMRALIASTLEAVHNLAVELRPAVLDDLGLEAALHKYAAEYQARHGIQVDFQSLGLEGGRLDPMVETAVYRIVQEALTNAAKHAQPSQISILVEKKPTQLALIVEDDGRGFDVARLASFTPSRGKLGLYGMYERAHQLGGSLVVESEPGQGTAVYVRIPLNGGTNAKNEDHAGR